ncbi:MAG: hypothetical protein Q8S73_33700 [Deltaproteobacteria bacterium]|nr:hypothetical protein [Myxococcales bacterium]MDP3219101.1 hypothetical protein [Deltaproteobacteria bacterium]
MPYRRSSPPPRPPPDAADVRAEDVVGVRELWRAAHDLASDREAERVRVRRLAMVTLATIIGGAVVVVINR